jgi:hypothetical protein
MSLMLMGLLLGIASIILQVVFYRLTMRQIKEK